MPPTDPVVQRTAIRVALQTAVLVAGLLAVLGLVVFGYYQDNAHRADQHLLDTTTSRVDEPDEAPADVYVSVVGPHGISSTRGLPAGLPDRAAITAVRRSGDARTETLSLPSGDFTIRTALVRGRVVQAALSQDQREAERNRLLSSLFVAGAVGAVLVVLASWWLARRSVRPLDEALRMQRRFVADASHEMRTPLTLLSTRAQLVARRSRSGRATKEDYDGVVVEAARLTEILDDLLAATDTRAMREAVPVSLAAVVTECVAAVRPHAATRGVRVVWDPPAGPPQTQPDPAVLGVAAALHRAVLALVDNAVDHAQHEVTLTLSRGRRRVTLFVSDDGAGLAPDVGPQIFDRFSGGRTAGRSGTRRHYGLGLALVADVAAMHAGSVETGPRLDGRRGAQFRLNLPTVRR